MSRVGPIGIVGLGTMGLGIAQVFASAGFAVLGVEDHAPARASAHGRMAAALDGRVAAGKLTTAQRDAALARFSVGNTADLAPCAVVIEAIVEDLAAKQALFAGLESVVAPGCLLCTNTSSIPVASIASALNHPERCLALHFFNPAAAMKLVELAAHEGTASTATARARALCEAAGKTVIQCPDRPGFIVNRCARPYYGEALALLHEGRAAAEVDAAMQSAGYRLGPFALIDLIGADINLAATTGLYTAMGQHPRYHPFAALREAVLRGDLGRKSGRGFVTPPALCNAPPDSGAIVLRIEATLINEAHWLLAEGGSDAAGIDTAMRLGLNFPRGPFQALAQHGRGAVLGELARLRALAPPHMAARYDPAPDLEA